MSMIGSYDVPHDWAHASPNEPAERIGPAGGSVLCRACSWPRDRDLGGRLARQVLGDHDKAFERAGGIPLRWMMLARNRKFEDSPLEETVRSELVSEMGCRVWQKLTRIPASLWMITEA